MGVTTVCEATAIVERIYGAREQPLGLFLKESTGPRVCTNALTETSPQRKVPAGFSAEKYYGLSGVRTFKYLSAIQSALSGGRGTSGGGLRSALYLGLTARGAPVAVLSVGFDLSAGKNVVYLDDIFVAPEGADAICENQALILNAFLKKVVLAHSSMRSIETVRAFSQSSTRAAYLQNLGFRLVSPPPQERVVFNRPSTREVIDLSLPYYQGRYQVWDYTIAQHVH
jgi:hypothetical protein